MSRVRSFRFGPGSLESVAIRMWAVPRARESQVRSIKARAIGSYTVYCGMGWEHLVDIDEWHTFDLERPVDELERRLATAWTENDVGAADAAAAELVDWSLEGWEDPCSCEEE